ncbi:MAG: hypothetical protein GIKADHBN_03338 [Phycisphaerales bacterium]|nr:hypothetical protein [Phycisphaerales bacterium]
MVSNEVLAMVVAGGVGSPLPDGYAPVSIEADGLTPLLSMCVVVRTGPAAKGQADDGPLVILRERLDARCYLGCVVDAAQRVQRWVEVWVQDIDGLVDAPPSYRDAMTNARVDERWRAWCRSIDAAGLGSSVLRAGWENDHPAPMLIDLKELRVVRPVEGGSNGYWLLCEDDGLLASRGLPAYGSTSHRYLFVPELGNETFFVPVTKDAPQNDRCLTAEEAIGAGPGKVGLNIGAGLMLVRDWQGLSLDSHVDQLGGEKVVSAATPASANGSVYGTGLGPGLLAVGRAGRLLETLHLKLRLVVDAVEAVRDAVRVSGAPLLNVSAENFAVLKSPGGGGVPSGWTARATLREPGAGVGIDLAGGETTLYMGPGGATSVYSPGVTGANIAGVGSLRIRQVLADAQGAALEARLVMQERIVLGPGDLLWLRVSVGGQRLDLYATPDFKKPTAASEVPVRTVRQPMDDAVKAKLKSMEGVNIQGAMFEALPMAGPAHDLYALAVLGVRILLSGDRSLGLAWSDFEDFARFVEDAAASEEEGKRTPLEARIGRVMEGGDADSARWRDAVGPQHLRKEAWDPASALAVVTPGVWNAVLAMLVRAIPAKGPDSTVKSYGESPGKAPETVFSGLLGEAQRLAVKTRSLVVSDGGSNAEIRGLILRRVKA